MRLVALLLVLLVPLAAACPAAISTGYWRGEFQAADALALAQDACLSPLREGIDSNCPTLGSTHDAEGLHIWATAVAPTRVVGVRACFYGADLAQLACPDSEACTTTATWCATIPAGARHVGVTTLAGVHVTWAMKTMK